MAEETPASVYIAFLLYVLASIAIILLAVIKGKMTRKISERTAFVFLGLATAIAALPVLFIIVYTIINGADAINWSFLTQSPSQAGKAGGILPAIVGTFCLMLGTLVLALPIGVMAGIYLTEYAKQGPIVRIIRIGLVDDDLIALINGAATLDELTKLFKRLTKEQRMTHIDQFTARKKELTGPEAA